MTNEIIPAQRNLPVASNEDSFAVALRDHGINEEYLASNLKYIAENAVTETKKWDIMEDFPTKLSALKEMRKILKDQPDNLIQIANVFNTRENVL